MYIRLSLAYITFICTVDLRMYTVVYVTTLNCVSIQTVLSSHLNFIKSQNWRLLIGNYLHLRHTTRVVGLSVLYAFIFLLSNELPPDTHSLTAVTSPLNYPFKWLISILPARCIQALKLTCDVCAHVCLQYRSANIKCMKNNKKNFNAIAMTSSHLSILFKFTECECIHCNCFAL